MSMDFRKFYEQYVIQRSLLTWIVLYHKCVCHVSRSAHTKDSCIWAREPENIYEHE